MLSNSEDIPNIRNVLGVLKAGFVNVKPQRTALLFMWIIIVSVDQTAATSCLISSKRRLIIITFVRLLLSSSEFKISLRIQGIRHQGLHI